MKCMTAYMVVVAVVKKVDVAVMVVGGMVSVVLIVEGGRVIVSC